MTHNEQEQHLEEVLSSGFIGHTNGAHCTWAVSTICDVLGRSVDVFVCVPWCALCACNLRTALSNSTTSSDGGKSAGTITDK